MTDTTPPPANDPDDRRAVPASPPPAGAEPLRSDASARRDTPAYASAPAPGHDPAAVRPGRTLGIVALVLSFFLQLVGLILGIIALVQSRRAGQKNGFAVAAIIISIVLGIVGIVAFGLLIAAGFALGGEAVDAVRQCQQLGETGTVVIQGTEVSCADVLREFDTTQ